jgi:VWA domain-containing protein
MLLASLALHVGFAMGIALFYFHGATMPTVALSETATPSATVMLLRSEESPDLPFPQAASAKPTVSSSVVMSQPAVPPSPAQPMLEKALRAPAVTPPPALALEANPNAHLQALPPEAVLSPNPAPHLDSANGVVFILDISGSMYEPYAGSTRLALARQTLSRQIRALKDGTPFAITLYAQRACASGPLVAANNATRDAAVRFIMRDVDCGGGTNLPAGLATAEQLHPGALVLATDGDLNTTAFNLMSQALDILGPEGHCPGLTIVGIAPRANTADERLLQGLADQQGGTYGAEQVEGNAELVTSAASTIKPASATP